ncbi:hypothetical protein [Plantactinospora sp. DSM 117369]
MTDSGFVTDTDALRWYGVRCSAVADDLDDLNRRIFLGDAVLEDRVWGGRMMYLVALGWHLERLGQVYEAARRATAVRNNKIVQQLRITDTNLHEVARSYDRADRSAHGRFI